MGRKQKERLKKKNNQKNLAAATAPSTTAPSRASSGDAVGGGNNSATADRSSSVIAIDDNVDGDGDVDSGVAAAKKGTTTETTMARCYHGTTADNCYFTNGSNFQMTIDEWLTILCNMADKNPSERTIIVTNFFVKHKELMKNPEFNQCLFSYCTDIFLLINGSEEYSDDSKEVLQFVLDLGVRSKYQYSPLSIDREKCDKYFRDIELDRGIINILYRETNIFCNCMTPYKEVAKTMEKIGMCYQCDHEFPKMILQRCSRCLSAQYCTKECMKKHWPTHKQCCTPHNEQTSEE